MFLLPVSHEDTVVRRIPWVSVAILGVCTALQVYSSIVTPSLIERAAELSDEMSDVEEKAITAHQRELAEQQRRRRAVEKLAEPTRIDADRGFGRDAGWNEPVRYEPEDEPVEDEIVDERYIRYGASYDADSKKFRAGQLGAAADARYRRYKQLDAELADVRDRIPWRRFGYRPAIDGFASMLSSMFAHGGFLHLLGNMWFLYLVGCNLEDRWGRMQFFLFYVVAGCIAAATFSALHENSETSLVGASGAVAGAMGAFMVCFARTKVKMFYVYVLHIKPRWGTFKAPAWVMLLLWAGQELLSTRAEVSGMGSSVAHSAHAGGFLFGAAMAFLLKVVGLDEQLDQASGRAAEAEQTVWQEHPQYLAALDQRARGDEAGAAEALVRLLGEVPDHQGACDVLFDLGVNRRDERLVDYGLPRAFSGMQQARAYQPLVAAYRELRRALPDYALTDKELLAVATAAGHVGEHALVIKAVAELMQQHPRSALTPRAMWLAAEAQARLGAMDLQRDTLERLLRRFPEHACATLATQALQRRGA